MHMHNAHDLLSRTGTRQWKLTTPLQHCFSDNAAEQFRSSCVYVFCFEHLNGKGISYQWILLTAPAEAGIRVSVDVRNRDAGNFFELTNALRLILPQYDTKCSYFVTSSAIFAGRGCQNIAGDSSLVALTPTTNGVGDNRPMFTSLPRRRPTVSDCWS